MQYTEDEITYVGGIFTNMFSGRKLSNNIFEAYRDTYLHIQQRRLNIDDLHRIHNALQLAQPMLIGISNEEDHLFTRAMLTTNRMIMDIAG